MKAHPSEEMALAQVQAFLNALSHSDWEQPDGPMRLSSKVPLEAVQNAPFYANVRLLLQMLADEDGADATATGKLTRAFVSRIFDRLVLGEPLRQSIRRVCKVVNEEDVWALHLARVVAECGRLLRRRGKRFALTPLGRRLLPDPQAGALYRAVFVAYFRRFDITYDFHLRPVPEIQQTFAAILWRLDLVARDWTLVEGLAKRILLPKVYLMLRQAMTHPDFDTEEWIFGGHVLQPLLDLGLIEKEKGGGRSLIEKSDRIRITRLWRQFIWFEWQL